MYSTITHRSTHPDNYLPWIVSSAPADELGSRTWYISFRSNKSFQSAFSERGNSLFGSCHTAGYTGREDIESGFDPTFLLPWLGNATHDKVILCGYSLGGAIAQLEFNRILNYPSFDGDQLLRSGR